MESDSRISFETYMAPNQDYLEQILDLLKNDEDWIFSRRHGFSATKLAKRYPDGVPAKVISEVLQISEEELEAHYERIVQELQVLMKVNDEKVE